MPADSPGVFRTGSVLATVFTGTLTERHGVPVEHIPTPERLLAWLDANGLGVARCSAAQHERAIWLREAVHTAVTAAATGAPLPAAAVETINECAQGGRAAARLTSTGERRWRLGGQGEGRVEDALAVVAADTIALLSGATRARLALCASPTCRAAFADTSQSRTRRWCDMNTCGNREKKARFRSRSGGDGASG